MRILFATLVSIAMMHFAHAQSAVKPGPGPGTGTTDVGHPVEAGDNTQTEEGKKEARSKSKKMKKSSNTSKTEYEDSRTVPEGDTTY